MIQAISFGNRFVSESSIIAEKEARQVAKQLAADLLQRGKSKKVAKDTTETVTKLYSSPFANYSQTESAFPHYPSPEVSYALSHGHVPVENGQILNIISYGL